MKRAFVVAASVLLASLAVAGAVTLSPGRADAATVVRSCTGGTVEIKSHEKRMLQLHNRARAERGLRALCIHPRLQKAARAHSRDMARRDYFGHYTRGRNESACERMRRFGYRYTACAENIAWGMGAKGRPGPIFRNSWMESRPHRASVLDGRFREAGVGAYRGNFQGRANVTIWTVDFGRR